MFSGELGTLVLLINTELFVDIGQAEFTYLGNELMSWFAA